MNTSSRCATTSGRRSSNCATAIDAAIASGSDISRPTSRRSRRMIRCIPCPPQQSLLQQASSPPLKALLDQQVRDPLAERALRPSIPALTAIDDAVSVAVREQYEDMPYPRWVKTAPLGRPTNLDWYLRNQFPAAPIQSPAHARPA